MMFLLGLCALVVGYLLDGLALVLLWGWFIIPVFDLPSISLVEAIGLGIVVGFLTHTSVPRTEEQRKALWIELFTHPAIAISVGWVVHFFM